MNLRYLAKGQFALEEFANKPKKEIQIPLTYGYLFAYRDVRVSSDFEKLKFTVGQEIALNSPERVISLLEESIRLSEGNPKMQLLLRSNPSKFSTRSFQIRIIFFLYTKK